MDISRLVVRVAFFWIWSSITNDKNGTTIMMWGCRSFSVRSVSSWRVNYDSLLTVSRGYAGSQLLFVRGQRSCVTPFKTGRPTRSIISSTNWSPRGGTERAASSFNHRHESDEAIVTYMTDVEGDRAYLDRYVEKSKVLTFRHASTIHNQDQKDMLDFPYLHCMDFTDPRAMLVFGGDIWDKGGHDLYTIRQLLDLKRRYPHRVIFILGNRDINKLRILQEIGLQDPVPYHPGLMWFKGSGRVGDPDSNPPPRNSAERLQWMLADTMGSPDAFELRRRELEWERSSSEFLPHPKSATNTMKVTDEEVVDSYRSSCHPRGELGQFLSQAQLICRLGPLLFVHGSLPLIHEEVVKFYLRADENGNHSSASIWDDLTVFMPWLPEGETAHDHGVTTIDQWMTALNEFCHQKVKEWQVEIARIESIGGVDDSEQPIWALKAGYHFGPSYSDLIQYGMGMLPNRKKNPTVVYNTFTPSGMPNNFYPDSEEPHMVKATKEFFDRAKVQVILAGHKPQGDMPSPIRVDDSAWVVLGDTSYSGETIWHHHDNDDDDDDENTVREQRRANLGRGKSMSFRGEVAVSEILMHLEGEALVSLSYHGVLSDGSEYETVDLLTYGKNSTIGQVAPQHLVPSELDSPHQGRWWTKSIFSDGSYLFHAGKGFHIWNFVGKPSRTGTSKK